MPGAVKSVIVEAATNGPCHDLQPGALDCGKGLGEWGEKLQPAMGACRKGPTATPRDLDALTQDQLTLIRGVAGDQRFLNICQLVIAISVDQLHIFHTPVIGEADQGQARWGEHPAGLSKNSRHITRVHTVHQEILNHQVDRRIHDHATEIARIRHAISHGRYFASDAGVCRSKIIEIDGKNIHIAQASGCKIVAQIQGIVWSGIAFDEASAWIGQAPIGPEFTMHGGEHGEAIEEIWGPWGAVGLVSKIAGNEMH